MIVSFDEGHQQSYGMLVCILPKSDLSGVYIEGVTPLPIPNREVKPLGADGTMRVTAWESRSMPDLIVVPLQTHL